MHSLEMPNALARSGIQREQGVGKKICSDSIAAIEVGRRRTGRDVNDSASDIDAHARPRIRSARRFPRVGRPCLVPELSRMRYSVKRPANLSGVHVESANVSGRRTFLFTDADALNQQIFEDHTGARGDNVGIVDVAAETSGEIYPARIAERGHRLARGSIQRVEPTSSRKENPPLDA